METLVKIGVTVGFFALLAAVFSALGWLFSVAYNYVALDWAGLDWPRMHWDPSGDVSEGFGPAWVHELPNPGMTVEEWRALLKMWGRTKWLPMPPPGGGK